MKKYYILFSLCIALLFSGILYADLHNLWDNYYGGPFADGAKAIIEANDSGLIIAGYTYSDTYGYQDMYVLKVDEDGNEVWSNHFGGSNFDAAFSLCKTVNEDGYILLGNTASYGEGSKDIYAVKITNAGAEDWSKTYGGTGVDLGRGIIRTSDDAYVICGYTESSGAGEDDMYILKIDADGDTLWTKTIGTSHSETAENVIETSDGHYLVVGSTGIYDTPGVASGNNRDIYLVKMDASGNVTDEGIYWVMTSGQGSYDDGFDVCEISDGGFVVIGGCTQELVEVMDIALIKTDANLSMQWKKHLEVPASAFYDFAKSIVYNPLENTFLICGSAEYTDLSTDLFIMKMDAEGDMLWTQTYGGAGNQSAFDILLSSSGYCYVVGQSFLYGGGGYNVWLLKFIELSADFEGTPNSGHAPLEVQFGNFVLGTVDAFEWDLDGDGSIDSTEPTPVWTYADTGSYNVSLTVTVDTLSLTELKEKYIRVFDGQSSLEFGEGNNRVTCTSDLYPAMTEAFSVEAWINPTDYGIDPFFGFGRIFERSSILIYLSNQFPTLTVESLVAQIQNESSANYFFATENNSITLNQWQHVAVTYDGIDKVCMYINGESKLAYQSGTLSGAIKDNASYDILFGNSADYAKSFTGRIDEVRVWNVCRSQADIQAYMNMYLHGYETGLIGYFTFDEGYGDYAHDEITEQDALISLPHWAQGYPLNPVSIDPGIEPDEFTLSVYPNPACNMIHFSFSAKSTECSVINIYNILGQKVNTLNNNNIQTPGHMTWNCTDFKGNKLANGIYFCELVQNEHTILQKVLLLR